MENKERDAFILKSLNQGMSLSDVQKGLEEQFAIRMTYLDLRMIAAELDVDWKKQDKPAPVKKLEIEDENSATPQPEDAWEDGEGEGEADLDEAPEDDLAPDGGGKTKVTVSKLVRPGAALSGDVEFSSGAKGDWYVDNMGRLGFNPAEGSGQPSQKDLKEFQQELQKALGY